MGMNWSEAASGAVEGGAAGSRTGNPYVAAAAAIAKGLLGLFSKRKEDGSAGNFAAKANDATSMATSAMNGMGSGGSGGGSYASMIPAFLSKTQLASQNQKNGLDENGSPMGGGSFSPEILTKAFNLFGNSSDEESAPADGGDGTPGMPDISKLLPKTPSFGGAPSLLGFPAPMSLSQRLRGSLASRRGY